MSRPRRTHLNTKEVTALQLVANGHTVRQAARHLGETEHAVATRITRATARLGANHRSHAIALALGAGLIQPPTTP